MKLPCLRFAFVLLLELSVALFTTPATSAIIRVKWDSPNNGPGNDWDHAYRTISAGTAASITGDEIWVAGSAHHPYYERVSLKKDTKLFGGFAGNETERDQRDWNTNPTVIDGRGESALGGVSIASGSSDRTMVDGFFIRGASSGVAAYNSAATIQHNIISGCAEGIYYLSSTPIIANNVIFGNGIGINGKSSLAQPIANNTIIGNGIGLMLSTASPLVRNNIIAHGSVGVRASSASKPVLQNNCVYNPGGVDYDNVTAGATDLHSEPCIVSVTYARCHIQAGSPCIDAGVAEAVQAGWQDVDGQARILGDRVDIGADESDGSVFPSYEPLVVRVSPAGVDDDSHDGSTWALAKRTIQAALSVASASGGEVWVSAGTYPDPVRLLPSAYLYGGFAGNELAREQRNPSVNTVAISQRVAAYCGTLARIDGFTISSRSNGGISCGASSPSIVNNTIQHCLGPGIAIEDGSPLISHNSICRNYGEGIKAASSYAFICNNTIVDNFDGVFTSSSAPHGRVQIKNNIISGNRNGIQVESGSSEIVNNTISGNSRGIYLNVRDSIQMVACNNIVAFGAYGIYSTSSVQPTASRNCLFNPDGSDYVNVQPGNEDILADPMFVSSRYGHLRIQPGSPCIDSGDNAAASDILADIDGQSRVQGGQVDLGADESDGTVWPLYNPAIVRVRADGADDADHDGSSWELAKKTVTAAVETASASGGDVWVAEGEYPEDLSIPPYVYLYGGFSGWETTIHDRNWHDHPAVVRWVMAGATPSRLDGFRASKVSVYTASPTIANNTITGSLDCGIECEHPASPLIFNNIIYGNPGYGIKADSCPARIVNNTVYGNESTGIYATGVDVLISGNFVYGHARAGIGCSGAARVVNNTVVDSQFGNSVMNTGLGTTISNNIVAFCAVGVSSPSNKDPVLASNCLYNPTGIDYEGLDAGTTDISADPLFHSRDYGRLHIQPNSPCIDAGASGPVQPWTDIDGQSRPQGGAVDIGADESDGMAWPEHVPVVIRVSPAGADDHEHDGSSWDLGKKTVQAGVIAASAVGGEVWVAAGTYQGEVTLLPYVSLYGGFAGYETMRSERDWTHNITILGVADSATQDVVRVHACRPTALDGFSIVGGRKGILCPYTSPVIRNNVISGCGSTGISVDHSYSAPLIEGNVISSCKTYGIQLYEASGEIANNTIAGNGTGIWCSAPVPVPPTIRNNVISFNQKGIVKGSVFPLLSGNCVYNPSGTNYSWPQAGADDIHADPLFINRVAGDYHLQPNSPCINAGLNSAPGLPLFDFDGQGRVFGGLVDIGADEWWSPALSIPDLKRAADGAVVTGDAQSVIASWPDFFYIEGSSRAAGLRVSKAAHGLSVGQGAAINGVMSTTAQGERVIKASSVAGASGVDIAPLALMSRAVGGSATPDYSSADTTGQQGILGGVGINTIGLLVTISGRVTSADHENHQITVWDGSGWPAVAPSDPVGRVGIRATAPGMLPPGLEAGDFVTVTGVVSCTRSDSSVYPEVLVRDPILKH